MKESAGTIKRVMLEIWIPPIAVLMIDVNLLWRKLTHKCCAIILIMLCIRNEDVELENGEKEV